MDRRELLTNFSSALMLASIPATVMAITAERAITGESPTDGIVVIHCDHPIGKAECEGIRTAWADAVRGTNLEGMKAVILPRGYRLTIEREPW